VSDADETVHLDVPAASGRLRLVRLAVVGLATEYGADVDDLEDVRIATGEICTHLVNRAGPGDRLVVQIRVTPNGDEVIVGVDARVEGIGDPGDLDELSNLVLATTATSHGIEVDGSGSSSWFRRHLRPVIDAPEGGDGGRRPHDG
jgi:serine/threonine-protein kinase RsbW